MERWNEWWVGVGGGLGSEPQGRLEPEAPK